MEEINVNMPEHVFKKGDTVRFIDTPYAGTIKAINDSLFAVAMPQEAIDAGYEPIETVSRELIAPAHMYIYEVLPRLAPHVDLSKQEGNI